MKIKIFFLTMILGVFSPGVFAQAASEECAIKTSIMVEKSKVGLYEEAYEPFMYVRKNCPKYTLATYQYGEMILQDFIAKSVSDSEKRTYTEDLIAMKKERLINFPDKTTLGGTYADIGQLMYDNKVGTSQERYGAFDKAFKEDLSNFTSPKSIYTYFSILVDMQDANQVTLAEVFDKYDDIMAKIEEEENKLASMVSEYSDKKDVGTLTEKEEKYLANTQTNLEIYGTIKGSINAKLGQRADCENLIPLYKGEFEENKNNVEWLRRAAGRLSIKECTEDQLFFMVVEQLHKNEPSSKSAYYLGQLAAKQGNHSKSIAYFNQSAELETNSSDRARIYYSLAREYYDSGNYSTARSYARKALEARPSFGSAYLLIANMYGKSINNCGNSPFEKRAVYWLAAQYADKAARVDPSVASSANEAAVSYRANAPSKKEIFTSGMQGQRISFDCWIGESITVPNL